MSGTPPIAVHVPTELGGVRHVTESLSRAIEENGRAVVRVPDARALLRARAAGVKSAILSLHTGFLAPLFERSVYILHGFPLVHVQSPLRRVAIRAAARVARSGGARLVAVSHLTRAVHENLYGIPVDEVIFNGCSESLHERARVAGMRPPKAKAVAFVGRLVEGKGVRAIMEGFLASSLPSRGYVLRFAGAGPLATAIAEIGRRHPEIELLGEVSEAAKEELLLASEAFVSLNSFEPMGVVFVEAVLCGCKVVAPFCGGHREFIPVGHPLAPCDPYDVASIGAAFDRIPSMALPGRPAELSMFSYRETIAPRYLRALDSEVATTDVLMNATSSEPSRAERRESASSIGRIR